MSTLYSLIIGTKNWSSWSLRPWLALKATGVSFDEIVIALRQPDTAARIGEHSPSGKVPVLKITGNGQTQTVFDSLAICETLAEQFPNANLWPKDKNARGFARSIAAAMHSGFPDLRSTLPMDFARRIETPALSDAVKNQIAEVEGYWNEARNIYGKGGEFLFGEFSIADCMYAPVVSRFVTYNIAIKGTARAYMDAVMNRDAMKQWGEAAAAEVAQGKA
ncbi:MAG TPA: glutathione S-transferase family protein [Rhizomicrobium sp.]|nr:glutathione S-transferase family protein [Rhizomicrobium sp.]